MHRSEYYYTALYVIAWHLLAYYGIYWHIMALHVAVYRGMRVHRSYYHYMALYDIAYAILLYCMTVYIAASLTFNVRACRCKPLYHMWDIA